MDKHGLSADDLTQPIPDNKKPVEKNSFFTENNSGVWYEKSNGEGREKSVVKLCNFQIKVYEQIERTNGEETTDSYNVNIFCNGKIFAKRELPFADIPKLMDWIHRTYGAEPYLCGSKNNFNVYFSEKAKDVPKKRIYEHTGLVSDKFLHGGGAIIAGGVEQNTQCELIKPLKDYTFVPLTDDVDEATECMKHAFELMKIGDKSITYPMISYMFLAPLTAFSSGDKPEFALYAQGKTGSFKTTGSKLFTSFFTNYSPSSVPGANFEQTANYIELLTFLAKDVVILIDDYHPGQNKQADKIFQRIARGVGDGNVRGRLNKDSKAKQQYYSRCLPLITGETFPDITASGNARLCVVDYRRDKINLEKLTECQNNEEKYHYCNRAMHGFISWLLQQDRKELSDKISSSFRKYRTELQDNLRHGAHARTPSNLAWLMVGFEFFLEYGIACKSIWYDERNQYLEDMTAVLTELNSEQTRLQTEENPVEMFKNGLSALIGAKQAYLERISSGCQFFPEGIETSKAELIGYYDSDCIYLCLTAFGTVCQKYYRHIGKTFPIDSSTLYKHMLQEGLIPKHNSGSSSYRKRIGSTNSRYICVGTDFLMPTIPTEVTI